MVSSSVPRGEQAAGAPANDRNGVGLSWDELTADLVAMLKAFEEGRSYSI